MTRRQILLAAALALGAAGFFALGWLASRGAEKPETNPSPSASIAPPTTEPPRKAPLRDAGPPGPVLLLDASVDLLPGKELKLEPPTPPSVSTNPTP